MLNLDYLDKVIDLFWFSFQLVSKMNYRNYSTNKTELQANECCRMHKKKHCWKQKPIFI